EKGQRAQTLNALGRFHAAALDSGHAPSRWRATLLASVLAVVEGRFAEGEALAGEAVSIGLRFGIRIVDPLLVHRAHQTWRGSLAGALTPRGEEIEKLAESAPGRAFSAIPLARVQVERDALDAARQQLTACRHEDVLASLAIPPFLEATAVVASALKDEALCDV